MNRHPIPLSLLIAIISTAALARLLPHPPNVAPIAAMALFGGAYAHNKRLAFLVPLLAMLASDLFIGFHREMLPVYVSFLLITCIGLALRGRMGVGAVAGASMASSVLFFLISNAGVWAVSTHFPKTAEGLLACYAVALPFFRNTLLGDLFFTGLLFGGYALLERRFGLRRG